MEERENRDRQGSWLRKLKDLAHDTPIKRKKVLSENGHEVSEFNATESNSSLSATNVGSSSTHDANFICLPDDNNITMLDHNIVSDLNEGSPVNFPDLPAFPEYDTEEFLQSGQLATARDDSSTLFNLDLPTIPDDIIEIPSVNPGTSITSHDKNPTLCKTAASNYGGFNDCDYSLLLLTTPREDSPVLSIPDFPDNDIPILTNLLTSQQCESPVLRPDINLPSLSDNDAYILDEKSGLLLKAFTCNDCMKKFRKKNNLIQHIKKKHKKERKNICKKEIRKTKKMLRASGKEYKTLKGKTILSREYQTFFCRKCSLKCTDRIPQEEIEKLFNNYWKLGKESGNQDQQRQYVSNHVEIGEPVRRRVTKTNSRKQNSMAYYVTVNDKRLRVCRYFFLNCHGVTEKFVRMAIKKRVDNSGLVQPDLRGLQPSGLKTSDEDEQFARNHILSIPAVESHYCRKSSTRKYLPAELNLSKLYGMYTESCKECNRVPISISVYKKYFYSHNLSFHTPRKDTCNTCQCYASLDSEQKEEEKENYDNHLKLKDRAREIKNLAIANAKENLECSVINFDMQAVLECPKGKSCTIFYKRKFATYNLTIYDLITHRGVCNIWTECEGKRGSIEIATCIYKYIESSATKKHFFFMSDSCGGQNRNQFFATACLHAVKSLPHVQTIDHVFYQPGHSQQEGDSMHSAIERAAKNITINAPVEWITVCKMARKNPEPYVIKEYCHEDFIDWKEVASKNPIKKSPSVSWFKIKWLRYDKNQDNKIFYTYDYDSEFREIEMAANNKPALRVRRQTLNLPQDYTDKIPITKAKYNDLVSLCKSGVISRNFHEYYDKLPYVGD